MNYTGGLQKLGAQIREQHGYIYATCSRLTGADIHLDYPAWATENIMMAAVYARGVTVINNAARTGNSRFAKSANKMGAKIRGAGTDRLDYRG